MLRSGVLQDNNFKSVGMRRSLLEDWMSVALQACEQGIAEGQSPFGAAIYSPDGELVVAEFNRVDADNDPTAHAEVLAIRAACQTLGVKKLDKYWLVATGEPCLMCASVAVMSGIRNVAFGADCAFIDSVGFQTAGVTSQRIFDVTGFAMQVEGAILRERCEALLRESRPSRSI